MTIVGSRKEEQKRDWGLLYISSVRGKRGGRTGIGGSKRRKSRTRTWHRMAPNGLWRKTSPGTVFWVGPRTKSDQQWEDGRDMRIRAATQERHAGYDVQLRLRVARLSGHGVLAVQFASPSATGPVTNQSNQSSTSGSWDRRAGEIGKDDDGRTAWRAPRFSFSPETSLHDTQLLARGPVGRGGAMAAAQTLSPS
ncbi:hypothetical protein BT63DRAFT_463162 [Microthyrium microscopicum]|uniref:Uncharacterized protein n=1 Tax=Microthyrium microscopicum TaxID=703497 RepID=A0A6A6U321_9PEZI|nr:hypothetical protein BT63DRAFT_463162 [Microthyrium microscopicum]